MYLGLTHSGYPPTYSKIPITHHKIYGVYINYIEPINYGVHIHHIELIDHRKVGKSRYKYLFTT